MELTKRMSKKAIYAVLDQDLEIENKYFEAIKAERQPDVVPHLLDITTINEQGAPITRTIEPRNLYVRAYVQGWNESAKKIFTFAIEEIAILRLSSTSYKPASEEEWARREVISASQIPGIKWSKGKYW